MPETATRGRIEGGEHVLPMRVHWEDTDASGIVYYANYLRFIERGRSDLLRLAGLRQQDMWDRDGLALTVRSVFVDYLRPARLDDDIEVRSRLIDIKGASMTAAQSVRRAEEELIRAEVRIACIDGAGRARRLPAEVREALDRLSPPSVGD
jgi:acyl-CoA thioester hydrolase